MLWLTLRQLKSKDASTRERAVLKLAGVRDKRVLAALIERLTDPEELVKVAAARALGESADERAATALVDALSHFRRGIREVLGDSIVRLGQASVAPLIQRLSAAANEDARFVAENEEAMFAATLLGRLKSPSAIDALTRALEAHPRTGIGYAAADALEDAGWRPSSEGEKALLAIAKQEWKEVERIGQPAVEPLTRYPLKGHLSDSHVTDAIWTLGGIGGPRAVDYLLELVSGPRPDPLASFDVRDTAADALGRARDPRVVEPLLRLEREKVVRSMGAAAVPELTRLLQNGDATMRRRAASVLASMKDPGCADALARALDDTDITVRWEAAEGLANLDDPRAIAPLVGFLTRTRYRKDALRRLEHAGWQPATDSDRMHRAITMEQWSEAAKTGPEAIGPLLEVMMSTSSEIEQDAIEKALDFIDPEWGASPAAARLLPEVLQMLEKVKPDSGHTDLIAGFVLGKMGAREGVDLLIKALRYSNPHMRRRAAAALGKIADTRAFDALVGKLDDSEGMVRHVAAAALGRLGDERAVQPLLLAAEEPKPARLFRAEWACSSALRALLALNAQPAVGLAVSVIASKNRVKSAEPTEETLRAAFEVLAAMGSAPHVGLLLDATRDKMISEAAVAALKAVFPRCKIEIDGGNLAALASLDEVIAYVGKRDIVGRSGDVEGIEWYGAHVVDCSELRTLAVAELARRRDGKVETAE